jgi:uncharacterized protein YbaR (Trm112 family)
VYVELIDALRCPRPHADSWLVAAARETRDRCVVRGTLGCPLCRAEYPIEGGVARFDQTPAGAAAPPAATTTSADAGADDAMRLAALLGLAGAGGIVALAGTWDATVDPLLDLSDVRVLLVEPARGYVPREPVGALAGAWLPVAAASLRGVALDDHTATAERVAAAVAALRPGGRLVAPAPAAVPDGVRELARDARHWVAERDAPVGAMVPLRRARPG